MGSTKLNIVALVLGIASVDAYTCSESEQADTYGLFQAAAARVGCAPYANYAADNSVSIQWSCSTTSCTPTMMQLALQLPNCETPSDGVNRKTSLDDQLYNQCQLCTPDQQDQIDALWKSAAQTSACSPYATAGGTWFSWPCSATSCTATLKDLAYKVPSCIIGTQNERARILNGISACTGTTVATNSPAPAATSSGVSTSTPSTTKPPVESATSPPLTTTVPPAQKPNSGTSSAASDSEATQNFSSTNCVVSEVDNMESLFVETATSTQCNLYSSVTSYSIKIKAPCVSSCVLNDIADLSHNLPDCVYAYENVNKKKEVQTALSQCTSPTSGRVLQRGTTDNFFTLEFDSKDVIKGTTPAPTSANHVWTGAPLPILSSAPSFRTVSITSTLVLALTVLFF